MTDFIIHFLICNLLISGMIGILAAVRKILKSHLTDRTIYNLWFIPLFLMIVPFIPIRSDQILFLFPWGTVFSHGSGSGSIADDKVTPFNSTGTASDWMNDFTISVRSRTPSLI